MKAPPSAGLFYAETTVSGNASATVVFIAPKPVINSFSQNTLGSPNYLSFSSSGDLLSPATFSWNVSGATKFEVTGPNGAIYSGVASSYTWPKGSYVRSPGDRVERNETWTLRAWNGSVYTDYSIVIYASYWTDYTEPSG